MQKIKNVFLLGNQDEEIFLQVFCEMIDDEKDHE